MPYIPAQSNARKNKYWAIVPAAGIGRRLGAKTPKQYQKLHGREVLAWTLQILIELDFMEKIILVLHPDDKYFSSYLEVEFPDVVVVNGGEERQHSVVNGLKYLETFASDDDWILVHDAARPCLLSEDLNKLLSHLENDEVGGILASPIKDTLKHSDSSLPTEGSLKITSTLNRNEYWLAATPQLFRFRMLLNALTKAQEAGQIATDEAAAVEALGLPVKIVEGRSDNIKITSTEDLALAEFLLKQLGKVNA